MWKPPSRPVGTPEHCETQGSELWDTPTSAACNHVVFSKKERKRILTPELQKDLWPYMGGIARKNRMKALSIGGVEDHVHILLSIASTLDVSKAIQLIKGGSSVWIHEKFPQYRHVYWQEGYGAF